MLNEDHGKFWSLPDCKTTLQNNFIHSYKDIYIVTVLQLFHFTGHITYK